MDTRNVSRDASIWSASISDIRREYSETASNSLPFSKLRLSFYNIRRVFAFRKPIANSALSQNQTSLNSRERTWLQQRTRSTNWRILPLQTETTGSWWNQSLCADGRSFPGSSPLSAKQRRFSGCRTQRTINTGKPIPINNHEQPSLGNIHQYQAWLSVLGHHEWSLCWLSFLMVINHYQSSLTTTSHQQQDCQAQLLTHNHPQVEMLESISKFKHKKQASKSPNISTELFQPLKIIGIFQFFQSD